MLTGLPVLVHLFLCDAVFRQDTNLSEKKFLFLSFKFRKMDLLDILLVREFVFRFFCSQDRIICRPMAACAMGFRLDKLSTTGERFTQSPSELFSCQLCEEISRGKRKGITRGDRGTKQLHTEGSTS